MQTPRLAELFHLDEDGFLICTGLTYKSTIRPGPTAPKALTLLEQMIDRLGKESARAQALRQPITSLAKFSHTTQRLYVKVVEDRPVGFLKTGEKHLFHRDACGRISEVEPVCVLDIYVCEQHQRAGYGREIFEKFLRREATTADRLAYDRPSPKLIGFLKKHYGLADFVPQSNNYVIFNEYFNGDKRRATVETGRRIAWQMNSVSTGEHLFPSLRQQHSSTTKQQKVSSIHTLAHNLTKPTCKSPILPPFNNIQDSLEQLAQQVQQTRTKPPLLSQEAAKPTSESGKQSAKLRELTFHLPWATESRFMCFKTTSHSYGSGLR